MYYVKFGSVKINVEKSFQSKKGSNTFVPAGWEVSFDTVVEVFEASALLFLLVAVEVVEATNKG
jgi:hypothetical protein